MSTVTAQGRAVIADLASRYGLSEAAVEHMARAVANGGGMMAQFNVPELGGSGQWMSGGMTMVGDMFNHGLQNTVSNLCGELANAMAAAPMFTRPATAMGGGWPEWLGHPSATGGQNRARYAYFPQARRLAFDHGDGRPLVVLDTGDHNIGGFSQQQAGPGDPFMGVTVSSQYGQYALSSFPPAQPPTPSAAADDAATTPAPADKPSARSEADTPDAPSPAPASPDEPSDAPSQPDAPVAPSAELSPAPAPARDAPSAGAPPPASADAIIDAIERLAKLRDAGVLTEDEFSAKKTELLARL